MNKKQQIELGEKDEVVCAFAERASGPGWSNRPVWVIVRNNASGFLRTLCLQPEQQSDEVRLLYNISEQVSKAMVSAVNSQVTRSNENND